MSLNLVSSMIKDWGCDCVFFFNYNRVNMGVNNDAIKQHMALLFGEDKLAKLRQQLPDSLSPAEREVVVVQELCDALRQNGSRFVLPSRFKNDNGARTSHHLIFLSKNFHGYEIMKEIVAKESSDIKDGVANFEYNPRDAHYRQGTLFDLLSRPLDELQGMLLKKYAGRTIDFLELYEEHSVDSPYVKKNYKDVLGAKLDACLISASNPKNNKPPRKGMFSGEMRITFT
ncbi:MAG: three-Cys-motif partner protein TcmP [Clostridiales bacterium]|nr:three-Cys-motif partner protein TcmP [Clostridiales bacterium]